MLSVQLENASDLYCPQMRRIAKTRRKIKQQFLRVCTAFAKGSCKIFSFFIYAFALLHRICELSRIPKLNLINIYPSHCLNLFIYLLIVSSINTCNAINVYSHRVWKLQNNIFYEIVFAKYTAWKRNNRSQMKCTK